MPLLYQDAVLQTAFAEISTNVSTSATSYSGSLLSLTITTGENPVIVYFSVSPENTTATQWSEYRLLVDGVAKRGIAIFSTSSTNGSSGCLVYRTSDLTAGSHTFTIQWRTGTSGSAQISPISLVVDHATLYLEEVTV